MDDFKKPTTIQEQITLLKERGLLVEAGTELEDFLSHVNYYRLAKTSDYSIFVSLSLSYL